MCKHAETQFPVTTVALKVADSDLSSHYFGLSALNTVVNALKLGYRDIQMCHLHFFCVPQMSWRPTYRSSKFRNVYGKVANREHCFDGIPITKNVHDNHFCAVNSKFVAVVTESAGGGSFIVIPVSQVTHTVLVHCWFAVTVLSKVI